jgi:hypothetical protein
MSRYIGPGSAHAGTACDELRPLLDRLLIEAQGTPTSPTATRINELLIGRGIVPRQAVVAEAPKLSERQSMPSLANSMRLGAALAKR